MYEKVLQRVAAMSPMWEAGPSVLMRVATLTVRDFLASIGT